MPPSANIAQHLPAMAMRQPHAVALKIPHPRRSVAKPLVYLSLTFAELDQQVDAWTARLRAAGVKKDQRVLIMVRQGLPLIAAVFALFKHGAVPVVIDPGMGWKNFLRCVARSKPDALLGIPAARILSRCFPGSFRSVRTRLSASGNALARLPPNAPASECVHRTPTDLAAILFTSGSTGAAKGVCYEHGMFAAQVDLIRATYGIAPGEIDLPMLPIFALFNPALGMTTVVPEIDPSRPASVDPAKIIQAIQQENVTNSFGSPTLWNKIGDTCIQNRTTLPSLHRVLCAGAPVPAALWEKSREFLPNGQLHSPYGATEALPVSSISAGERNELKCRTTLGGACVGRPVSGMTVQIIRPREGPIERWEDVEPVGPNEIGEIVVRGPVVTKCYDAMPDATAAAKIISPGGIWHRMGDCGYIDGGGRLWFCGRKVECVETDRGVLYTEPVEQVFRDSAGVARCALIATGDRPRQQAALVVQPAIRMDELNTRQLAESLRERGRVETITRDITRFYFHPDFPVDVRHNAKIHRLSLSRWAATQRAIEIP